ncbi:hypothetical protein PLICRDRAFT_140722 [Plicaturopsis crispa FD-325 SS-3]|nr:hypothetical protein PLICRDRAFT_140722 [Plicaturopsis crispa FD-325 SS-3]
MAYQYVPPGSQQQQQPQQQQPTPSPYPYAYHPQTPGAYGHPQAAGVYGHPQTPGAYGAYTTAVSGYGAWPYPYTYVPQQQQQPYTPRPVPSKPHTPAPVAATPAPAPTPVPQQQQPAMQTRFSAYNPAQTRETVAAAGTGGATGRGRKQANFKGLFNRELKSLMYGFGDDRNPANDTVNVMEEILVEFITDVCSTAGASTRKNRLSVDDLRRALSRPADAKKLARMEELLFMQEDIKRARAQFLEEEDINHTKEF